MDLKKIFPVLMVIMLVFGCSGRIKDNDSGENNSEEDDIPTFYVSPGGDDSATGSKNSPWETVQHALETLSPGERAIIGVGTYHEKLYMDRSGSEGKYIEIRGNRHREPFWTERE